VHVSVSENFGSEGFVAFEVNCFVDKHGERLVGEEEVFFLCAKDTLQVWIGSGAEVTGDGGSGINGIDFAAITSYKGVLSHDPSEGGG
jgi:hypothetical protein